LQGLRELMLQLELKVKPPYFEQRGQKLRGLLQELRHLVCLKLALALQLDQPALVVALHSRERLVERVEQVLQVLVVVLQLFVQLWALVEHL
jgi:hypothetical protein